MPATYEIARRGFGLGGYDTDGGQPNEASEVGPLRAFSRVVTVLWVGHHPDLAIFLAVMTLVGFLGGLQVYYRLIDLLVGPLTQNGLDVLDGCNCPRCSTVLITMIE